MVKDVKQILGRAKVNAGGWSTKRRIIVFESDDWGGVRRPSQKVYLELLGQGVRNVSIRRSYTGK